MSIISKLCKEFTI